MMTRRRVKVIRLRSDSRSPLTMVATGFVGGLLLGAVVYAQQAHRHARALFSQSAVRRYLALGYLRGQPSVETVRLLRDYVDWEKDARLRRRAQEVLRDVEDDLD
jgi:predicted component of type VI protein secretion system